jgi:hypothetical protein
MMRCGKSFRLSGKRLTCGYMNFGKTGALFQICVRGSIRRVGLQFNISVRIRQPKHLDSPSLDSQFLLSEADEVIQPPTFRRM